MAQGVGLSNIYPAQQVLYTLGILCVLIPAYPSFKGGNVGVILLDLWLIVNLTILLINSCIWTGNVNNPAPVYCDITTAILAMSGVGYQAAFLCITRTLYRLSKAQSVAFTKNSKRKEIIIDLCIGIGLPILSGVTHGIVQGHRYNIVEDVGCVATTALYDISLPLYLLWPLCLALVSGVFGALALINLIKRRRQFDEHLASMVSRGAMKKNLYIRLMIICCFDILAGVPYYAYGIAYNIQLGLRHFTTWADLQSNWYTLRYNNRLFIDTQPRFHAFQIAYMAGSCALAFEFFLMFGLSQEARAWYWKVYYLCMKRFGVQPQESGEEGSASTPPRRSWLDILLRRRQATSNRDTSASIPVFNVGREPTSQGTVVTGNTSQSDPNTLFDNIHSKDKDIEFATMSFAPMESFRSREGA